MSKVQEKQAAIAMRRAGCSIKEIATKLNVSKGSVSTWCQEITLTKQQSALLKQKQVTAGSAGRQKGADMNRQKKLDAIAEAVQAARKQIKIITKRELFFLGLGLYWGEGVKSVGSGAALVNSDPALLVLGKSWFETCLQVDPTDFRPYIYISQTHVDRQDVIQKFWMKTLQLPRAQFKIIILQDRPKKHYTNHRTYFGVVSLRVQKGTTLKYKIQALITACAEADYVD